MIKAKISGNIFRDLKHLLYPEVCLSCSAELSSSENHVCTICRDELPYSNMARLSKEDNPTEKLFWGRIPLTLGYSHLVFQKNTASQEVLFRIKYKSDFRLAQYFGEEIGYEIRSNFSHLLPDLIIPVPLHHQKKFIRGYNQSEMLAKGILKSTNIPYSKSIVTRNRHTETQTKKGRFERWNNLQDAFTVHSDIKKYAHIVIVDDVVTTGSTIEQITIAIREVHPDVQISVVTLAIA